MNRSHVVQEQLILFLENMVLVDLLFAQCNDEVELANRGGYVKSQRERGAKKLDREQKEGRGNTEGGELTGRRNYASL